MAFSEYTNCVIQMSVCSPDGEQYQISALEDESGEFFRQTVQRSDTTLPTVNFPSFRIDCNDTDTASCDLAIDGQILSGNRVRLTINGTNCTSGTSFTETQVVELVLGGSCMLQPDNIP